MIGQDYVCAIADKKIAVDLHSRFAQCGNFLQERYRIEHNAISNDAAAAFAQHSAGYKLQHKSPAIDDDSMSGIMAASVARNHREFL